MQSSAQRRRLLRAMANEPVRTWMILAKCAGGLAAIALIAVIGASGGDESATISRAQETARHAAQPAQEHRQQVFNDRRQRFDGEAERRRIAEGKGRPANRSAVSLQ